MGPVQPENDSTLGGIAPPGRVSLWLSRAARTALLLVVALGAVGLLGLHTSSASISDNGYRLAVDYPRIARAGLDVLWQVTVVRDGGFDRDVTLAVTADYFSIYESQRFFPEPADETRDGQTLYLTFAKPPGDTLIVSYDAYIQPSSQRSASATVSVLEAAQPAASVHITTTLLP
jgi:hypothetical protein